VNGEGCYEGGKHSGEGGILGRIIFKLGDCTGAFGRDTHTHTNTNTHTHTYILDIGRQYYEFWLENLVEGILQGGTCCWEFSAQGRGILIESWS